jgi:hypothetical protein
MLSCIEARVDKDIFYDIYRPLLGGFFPEGIILEGVDRNLVISQRSQGSAASPPPWVMESVEGVRAAVGGVRVCPKGPSAGQSAVFIILDLFLGVSHAGEAGSFQREMADFYLPAVHSRLVRDFQASVAKCGSASTLVVASQALLNQSVARSRLGARAGREEGEGGGSRELEASARRVCDLHAACLSALAAFRKEHMRIAVGYLCRTSTGTGASSFKHMLGSFAADTREAQARSVCPSPTKSTAP